MILDNFQKNERPMNLVVNILGRNLFYANYWKFENDGQRVVGLSTSIQITIV